MAITMDTRNRGERRSSALGAPSTSERERAFRSARRHTKLVRFLRLALPISATAFLAFYGLILATSWRFGPGSLNVGQIELTADDLTMKNPSYFGLTKDGGRYEVRAKKAILEFNQQAPIKLVDVDGDLVQANNVVTKLKAKHGLLDNAKSELELYDGIEIDASNGLKARMSRATVYSKENRVISRHPVDVTMPTGRVRGSAMTMRTDTRETTFVGNVSVRLAQSGLAGQNTILGGDARQPVDVTSEQLYVNDNARAALFTGSVVAVQGESTLRSPQLHVLYEGRAAAGLTTSSSAQPSEGSRLSRLVAKDGAVMTSGIDRRVSSDEVDFDARADTALFTGNVLVNQQRNVLQGRRLYVDRRSGRSRLDSPGDRDQPAGRIAATMYQSDNKAPAPAAKAKSVAAGAVASLQDSLVGSFRTDPNAPMDVEADTLDVHDQVRQAIFRGNVKAQQGDFVVRTVEMVAFYAGQAAFGIASAAPGPGEDAASKGSAQLLRIEARQKVLITSRDGQTATGDWADFDVKANTVLLGGRVVVSRGKDVAEGPRLKIDLTTGMYRFEVEPDAAPAPAVSASPPASGPQPTPPIDPASRTCPPGKQCLLFYPKEAQEKAKGEVKRLLSNEPTAKPREGWQPSTSASPALRSQ